MPKKQKKEAEKKEEKKPLEKKIESNIKEVKKEENKEELEINEEFFNEEIESELSESIGRAIPILRSGMIQERVDNLEEFADTLPSDSDSNKDKGYMTKTAYGDSYTSEKKYEGNSDKKSYDNAESFTENRRQVQSSDNSISLAQDRKTSFTESESKQSLDTFARQQERYSNQREQESLNAPFRHKEKREF